MENVDYFIGRAIALAGQGMNGHHGGPFGAVVVKDGKIVGEGHNRVLSTVDPSAHGEVTAIRDATRNMANPWLEGCDLYTSCEPCPMCLATSLWARIRHVFYAATRDDAAEIGFDDAAFYEELQMAPEGKLMRVLALSDQYRQLARGVMLQWPEKRKTY
ncbi:MAG: nucleoside deaminase [Candidatus Peribacteraceae bacterium]|nr:nucleoside deaminase [Candidatus Peribacteraceae bacterium]